MGHTVLYSKFESFTVSSRWGCGNEMKPLGEREKQDCALFKMGLGMADEEVDRDQAGADQGSGQSANGSADGRSGNDARAHSATVLDAVALEARAWVDCAFAADAGSGAGGSGDLRVEPEAGAVGQDHGVRIETHGAVAAQRSGGDIHDFAVDLRAGGNEHLAALQDVGGDAGAKGIAALASAVERRSSRRTRMVVPSPSSPGASGAGCTMSPSGSLAASATVQRGLRPEGRARSRRCRCRCRLPAAANAERTDICCWCGMGLRLGLLVLGSGRRGLADDRMGRRRLGQHGSRSLRRAGGDGVVWGGIRGSLIGVG